MSHHDISVSVHVRITSPREGEAVTIGPDRGVRVSGEAWAVVHQRPGNGGGDGGDRPPPDPLGGGVERPVDSVFVQLGDGDRVSATRQGRSWFGRTGSVEGGGRLPITATASFTLPPGPTHPGRAVREVDVRVDDTPPSIAIRSPSGTIDMPGSEVDVEASGTASDSQTGVDRVRVGVDRPIQAASFRSGEWSAELTLQGIGRHRIVARAVDGVGNERTASRVVETVDTGDPDLRITAPRASARTVNWPADGELTVEVEGTAADEGTGVAAVQWRLDDGPGFQDAEDTSGSSEPWSRWRAAVPLPDPGRHRVRVRCRDGAGNTRERRITIHADDNPPEVVDVAPSSPHTVFSDGDGPLPVEVRGTVADDAVGELARVEWASDDDDFQPAVPGREGDWSDWCFTAELEAFGTHRISIRSTHASGTVSDPHELVVRKLEVRP